MKLKKHLFGGKTKKTKKIKKNQTKRKYLNKKMKKNKNTKKSIAISKIIPTNKCNPGLLGAQEDIYTLGTCKKFNGGSGILLPTNYSQYAPVSGISESVPNGLAGIPINQGNPYGGWPGTNEIGGGNNHYSLNTYSNDISRQMQQSSMKGGKKHKKSKKIRGGGLFQELLNAGRMTGYGIGSLYNGSVGYPTPVNPLPTQQKLNI